jgi:hypothetical protein
MTMTTTKQQLEERERQYFATRMRTQKDQATGKVTVFYEGRRIGCFKNYLQAKEQAPVAIQQMKQAKQGSSKPGSNYRQRKQVHFR